MFNQIISDLRKEIEDLKWANRGTDIDITKLKIAKAKLDQTLLCEKMHKEVLRSLANRLRCRRLNEEVQEYSSRVLTELESENKE